MSGVFRVEGDSGGGVVAAAVLVVALRFWRWVVEGRVGFAVSSGFLEGTCDRVCGMGLEVKDRVL